MAILAYDEVMLREPRLLAPYKVPLSRKYTTPGLQAFILHDDGVSPVDLINGGRGTYAANVIRTTTALGRRAIAGQGTDLVLATSIPVIITDANLVIAHFGVDYAAIVTGGENKNVLSFGSSFSLIQGSWSGFLTNEALSISSNTRAAGQTDSVVVGDHVLAAAHIAGDWTWAIDGIIPTISYGNTNNSSAITSSLCSSLGATGTSAQPRSGGYSAQVYKYPGVSVSMLLALSKDPYMLLQPA